MREIKFRAWHKEKKKMLSYGELFNIDCSGEYPFLALAAGHYEDCIEPLKVELMQYTGLQDKNGVDIYEGDIIKADYNFEGYPYNICGFIVFFNGSFCAKTQEETFVIFNNNRPLMDLVRDSIEIIGNIYENPELLEGE